MAIGIVENLRSSYDYTNKSLNSFTDWVILITITMLMLAGVVRYGCNLNHNSYSGCSNRDTGSAL